MPRGYRVVGVTERSRQRRELRRGHLAQPDKRRVGGESAAEGEDRCRAAGEALGEQATRLSQSKTHQADAAPQPAHRTGQFDGVAANRVGRRRQAGRTLSDDHRVLKLGERARQPCCQAVRQQAERGVALGTIPAGDARTQWGLACVSAMPRQRAAAARMVRTARQRCIAPTLRRNVLLAGKPRS